MTRILLMSGIVSCLIAGVLFLVDLTAVGLQFPACRVQVYPAAFFALVGLVLLFRAFKMRFSSREHQSLR